MDLHSIRAVSRETGIHESSLRRWEEMGLLSPRRIDLGKNPVRVYTDEEMEKLKYVKDFLDAGMTVRAAFDWANTPLNLEQENKDNE